ncbi:MAG: hypothetical protein ACKPJJ_12295, partial [Planctomycetaceae bacterium]
MGSTQPSGLWGKRSTALQVLFAAAAVLATCAGSQWLAARSDEPDAAAQGVLPRPRDMAAEALDAASPELSARIETLWNTEATSEDRRKALAELQTLVPAIPADGPHSSLRQRLLRRIGLLSAALDAASVPGLQAGGTDYTAQLQAA